MTRYAKIMVLFLSVATDAGCWMPVQIKIDPY